MIKINFFIANYTIISKRITVQKNYDLIVVGGGASGMMAAITSAQKSNKVLLLEKLPKLGAKLKASGGGRCNITNTLSNEELMKSFGRNGRFMQTALDNFNSDNLRDFLLEIGVKTHSPDGFRVFPTSHNSSTIIEALTKQLQKLHVDILCSQKVQEILENDDKIIGVKTKDETFKSSHVVLAVGGLGYPTLGTQGDGYEMASKLGHKITDLFPAMTPLNTKEEWVKECRADTLAKVQIKIDLKEAKKLSATGDLIFTQKGIKGPVILDFAREITPFLKKYDEVPLLLNFTKGMNEDQIINHLKYEASKNPKATILELVNTLLPSSLSKQLCLHSGANIDDTLKNIEGSCKAKLIKILAWTPLHVINTNGFKSAMVTRGGVNLKEINQKTLESKIKNGIYFCGEIINLDGPCGGFNLQWAFSSGYLAGELN
jgi:hypothetical protein